MLRMSALTSAAAVTGVAGLAAAGPAAAGPAAAGVDTADSRYLPRYVDYSEAFRRAVADDKTIRMYAEPGREFLYRPGQLLVRRGDTEKVAAWLSGQHVQSRPVKGFAGVDRLRVSLDADIPRLVKQLRNPQVWGTAPPVVQPHHVLVGFDNIMGNPGSPPIAATPLPPLDRTRRGEGKGVVVGICDTGIWDLAGVVHPGWLLGAYLPEIDDIEDLYLTGDILALEAGHGTFVAGVLRQTAPGATFDPEPALTPMGLGDEETLVAAIDRLSAETSIINLSLGCFTQDDVPPLTLVNRLSQLRPDVVVVAAAGNSAGTRPSWPAALPDVIAVAAVEPASDNKPTEKTEKKAPELQPAKYSNYGPWVDACAIGTRTSTYVNGRLHPILGPDVFTGFAEWSGTSFATPHVAGRLASIMSAKGCTAAEAGQYLLSAPRWHPDYGVYVA
jgi:subtilisin family serine protease